MKWFPLNLRKWVLRWLVVLVDFFLKKASNGDIVQRIRWIGFGSMVRWLLWWELLKLRISSSHSISYSRLFMSPPLTADRLATSIGVTKVSHVFLVDQLSFLASSMIHSWWYRSRRSVNRINLWNAVTIYKIVLHWLGDTTWTPSSSMDWMMMRTVVSKQIGTGALSLSHHLEGVFRSHSERGLWTILRGIIASLRSKVWLSLCIRRDLRLR